ncbi:hypothetical protein ABPG75_007188 [Micractinium tetrahymenae]
MASPVEKAVGEAAPSDLAALLVALIDACSKAAPNGSQGSTPADVTRLAAAAAAAAEGGEASADAPRAAALLHLLRQFGWTGAEFAGPLEARHLAARLRFCLYDGLRPVGAGTYSAVFRARCCATGEAVALKRMRLERPKQEGLPVVALREVSLLRQLADSPHIVQLLDVLWDRSRLVLVFESMGRDLQAHLDADPAARQLPSIKSVMYQLLSGLAHAHARRVLHRDVKPANVLIDPASGVAKVADWGLARSATPPLRPYTQEVVTLLYRAPELLLGCPLYSSAVDVWSAGCILAELATGQPLFRGDSEIGKLLAVFRLLGTPGEEEWPGMSQLPDWQGCFPRWRPTDLGQVVPQLDPSGLDLLSQLLRLDPSRRPSCRAALAHPWFDDVRAAEEERARAARAAVAAAQQERRARLAAALARAQQLLQQADPGTPSQGSEQTAVWQLEANAPSAACDALHQAPHPLTPANTTNTST